MIIFHVNMYEGHAFVQKYTKKSRNEKMQEFIALTCSALHFAKGKAPPALQLPTKVITAQKLGLSSVTEEHIALPLETVHSETDAAAGNYAQC